MKIILAKYILTCNDKFDILDDGAVAFDERIRKIGKFSELIKTYPDATVYDHSDDILLPAFINLHTHLEFSANSSTLVYGDFVDWLNSVINSRNDLIKDAKDEVIVAAIKSLMKSGVATIGEISSFGCEMELCAGSGARFIFFNEILGSNEAVCEQNWDSFTRRFNKSLNFKSDKFIPAISLHSTYSVHPKLAKKAICLAKDHGIVVCTHFLESNHEMHWLQNSSGKLGQWLSQFNPNPKPFYTPNSFIEMFDGIRTLFVHCVYADEYLGFFDRNLHSLTHCAVSNRLLSKKSLNLKKVIEAKVPFNIATDGLSSNISLNFFDELRANLFIHDDFDLNFLSKELLMASTSRAAIAVGLNAGEIKVGSIADFSVCDSPKCDKNSLALQLILQTKNVNKLFIGGNLCVS